METETMPLAAEKDLKHIGGSKAAADHDHDMIHGLTKRLDAYWRYDQEEGNISRLKQFIAHHCEAVCF